MAEVPEVLRDALTNQGTAFSRADRERLGLVGWLPDAVLTLDQQARRAYEQCRAQPDDLAANLYLEQLHDRNEVLYYRLLTEHLTELLPVVYDPTVGQAVRHYSHEYRSPRGVHLSIDHPEDIGPALDARGLGPEDVDLLVVTDSEQILGIGDWGVHGVRLAVGKLSVYTAAAGVHPARCLPVVLDVGTNNQSLLNDPLYLGARHSRATGERYDEFVAAFLDAVTDRYPHALVHLEDFGPGNARRLLEAYGGTRRVFNDDLQGTGAITLAAVMNALRVTGSPFRDQRVVVFGAGTAGVGIADQLRDAMVRDGLSRAQATCRVWLVDRQGLLVSDMRELRDYQRDYARPPDEVAGWGNGAVDLFSTVRQVHPTILVGTSTVAGAFDERVVAAMAQHTERPVILPLSNPTERAEAKPSDLLSWTGGRALTATGVPADPVDLRGTRHVVAQANNALLYPGLGLGVIVARAERVTAGMLLAAAEAVAGQVEEVGPGAPLLPRVGNLRASSATVAAAVVRQAVREGVAARQAEDVVQAVQDAMWRPEYPGGDAARA